MDRLGHRWSRAVYFLFALGLFFPSSAIAEDGFFTRVLDALQGSQTASVAAPPSGSIEIAFSPNGGATDLILRAIGSAQSSIKVAAYSFTSRPIAEALISAHARGVDVRVLVDRSQTSSKSHSMVGVLANAGIPLHVDVNHAIQHNKYLIIDDKAVETGSFNYTASAESNNAENVLILWDAPALATLYANNWQELWDTAVPYNGSEIGKRKKRMEK